MITSGFVITFAEGDDFSTISVAPALMEHKKKDIADAYRYLDRWAEISEEDFLKAHKALLDSLRLSPKLTTKDPNDLKGVNI